MKGQTWAMDKENYQWKETSDMIFSTHDSIIICEGKYHHENRHEGSEASKLGRETTTKLSNVP